MTTLPQITPLGKPHYVYSYAYPESMGGHIFYIGKGIGERIEDHVRRLKRNALYKGDNPHKNHIIKKIWEAGKEPVRQPLAFFATHDEAVLYEIALIFLIRPYGHLANLTDGGDGAVGAVRSLETRLKLSKDKTGKKRDPFSLEWKQNLGESRRGQVRGSYSEEARQHMSEAQKKSEANLLIREKSRVRRARGELTEKEWEHLRAMSEANKGRKRGPMSEETKRKISEGRRKNTRS